MKQRGSAIIIAIFLITAVGSVAFGIGRLFALQSNISGFYENATIAYYSAESGVEEGLLRYRHNKNAVVTTAAGYENLSDMKQLATTPSDPVKFFYGMQMNYLGSYYGADIYKKTSAFSDSDLNDSTYIGNSEFKIKRDNSIKIDVSNLAVIGSDNGGDLNLYLRTPKYATGLSCEGTYGFTTGKTRPYIEAKVTGVVDTAFQEEKVALQYRSTGTHTDEEVLATSSDSGVLAYNNLLTKIRDSRDTYRIFTSGKVELSLKPIGCDVYFGLKPADATKQIAQPYSTIKSTGYYGGVTRTLEARIDRQAGTLYDLFDFVIYDSN